MYFTKLLVKLFLVIFSIVLTCITLFKVGERYYFDKLFYQKSTIHGYESVNFDTFSIVDYLNNRQKKHNITDGLFIKKRVSDLYQLINPNTTQVFATSTTDKGDVFKIAFIGDSFVYGQGVRESQRIGKVLEQKLNKITPSKVYNLGLNGDSLIDNFLKYSLAEKNIHPNLYIFGVVENDLFFNDPRYPGHDELMVELRTKCPLEEFHYYFDTPNVSYSDQLNKAYYPSFSEKYANVCYLNEILKKIDHNKSIFFIFNPEFINSHESDPGRIIFEKYSSYIKANKGTVFLPLEGRNVLYENVSIKEGHLSAKSQEKYADLLLKEIVNNPSWKFKNHEHRKLTK